MEGVEPSSAGCKPAVFPLDDTPIHRANGPGGSRTRSVPLKRRMLCQLSFKASSVCRAGVEPAQHTRVGYSHLGSPVPSRHMWIAPASQRPTCSGRRGSRTLKARRSSGFEPGAVANRLALPFQSGWLDSNQRAPASEAGG